MAKDKMMENFIRADRRLSKKTQEARLAAKRLAASAARGDRPGVKQLFRKRLKDKIGQEAELRRRLNRSIQTIEHRNMLKTSPARKKAAAARGKAFLATPKKSSRAKKK